MKKFFVITFAVLALVALALGSDILDLIRLQKHIDASAAAYQADGGPWPHLTDVCTGCHGFEGRSQDQRYPSLAGQPAPYVAAQLRNFASGQRASANMGPLAMTLSDAEIKSLSGYFAGKSASANVFFKADAPMREKGKQLVATGACAACHGDHLLGHDAFPRLAGQGYDYLVAQLNAFADGSRSEPTGTMKKLAAAASPDDRKAIATFLASLAPEKN